MNGTDASGYRDADPRLDVFGRERTESVALRENLVR